MPLRISDTSHTILQTLSSTYLLSSSPASGTSAHMTPISPTLLRPPWPPARCQDQPMAFPIPCPLSYSLLLCLETVPSPPPVHHTSGRPSLIIHLKWIPTAVINHRPIHFLHGYNRWVLETDVFTSFLPDCPIRWVSWEQWPKGSQSLGPPQCLAWSRPSNVCCRN